MLLTQHSNLPFSKRHASDLNYRPVLGIYKGHAEIDFLETRAMIQAAEAGSKQKKVDLKTLFASFGNESVLSVLRGNLRILEVILNNLQAAQLADTEDIDGTASYHPDLRRLAGVLLRKTYFEKDGD